VVGVVWILLKLAMTDNKAAHNARANELTDRVGNDSVVHSRTWATAGRDVANDDGVCGTA
jgi:hypothetical protein